MAGSWSVKMSKLKAVFQARLQIPGKARSSSSSSSIESQSSTPNRAAVASCSSNATPRNGSWGLSEATVFMLMDRIAPC